MPWFYVDDAFADSKPVMALDRALRNEAIGLWVRCGAWSAKEETDGRVPMDVVRGLGGTPRLIKALQFQAGLWQKPDENTVETMVETTGKKSEKNRAIIFANWAKWQKTKSENEDKRRADAARQANHRRSKKGRGYVPPTDAATPDSGEMSQRDEDLPDEGMSRCESQRPDPDPTRPDPSFLLVTSSGGVTSVDADDPEPPRYCPKHPNDTADYCPACIPLRKAHDAWKGRQERRDANKQTDELEAKRRERELRETCATCEGSNWIPNTEPAVKCNHGLGDASNA